MSKIERLTSQQELDLITFRDDWFKKCSTTEPADRKATEKAIIGMYSLVGKKPCSFVWCDSPATALMAINVFKKEASLWASLWASLGGSLRDSLGDSLGGSLWDSLWDSLWGSMRGSLRGSLRASLGDSLWASLGGSLRDSLWGSLRASLRASLGDSLGYGQSDGYWIAFYLFCKSIGVKYKQEDAQKLSLWSDYCLNSGWWWPYENISVVADRPCELHWEKPVVGYHLHYDGGPSVKFRDGYSLWHLHGVRVPQWLAETPTGQIEPQKLHEIENADVRREFVRKVGVERLCYALHANEIDRLLAPVGGEYVLLELDACHGRRWRYLRMENPSVPEVWHVEGVPNECQTVHQALNFRNGLTEDQIDDENGAEWAQQGDVILRPKGATKFKRFPTTIS